METSLFFIKNIMNIAQKLKIEFPYHSSVPFLVFIPRTSNSKIDIFMVVFMIAVFTISGNNPNPQGHVNEWCVHALVYVGIYVITTQLL